MSPSRPTNLDAVQAEWYARLKEEGFEDIEDHSYQDKPLKNWSGIPATYWNSENEPASIIDVFAHQDAGTTIQSSFPEKRFIKEESLLNHAEFDEICAVVSGHGNSRLNRAQVREIWEKHLEGATNRGIAAAMRVNYMMVYRTIVNLTKWAESMGEETEISTVVVREYDKERDAPMLFSTWRKALWFDTPGRDESLNHKFFRECTKLIKTILLSPETKVRVACLSDDPNLIVGTLVLNKSNLVWVYVKADYRGKGVATLLSKGFTTVSNPSTRIGKAIVKNKGLKIHGKY